MVYGWIIKYIAYSIGEDTATLTVWQATSTIKPTKWVPCLFPGGKSGGARRWQSTPSSAEVKERIELYLYSHPSWPSWPVLVWPIKHSLSLTKKNQFIIFIGINAVYFDTLAISASMTGGRRAEFFLTAGGVYSRGGEPRNRPRRTHRVSRDIAQLLLNLGTRRGWVVSITPRPPLLPGKTRYPLSCI
jgi:hypothetical protein